MAIFLLLLVSCSRDIAVVVADHAHVQTEIGVRPMGGTLTRSAISGTSFPQGYDMMVSTFHNAAKKVVLTVPDNSGKFDDLLYGALNA